MCYINDMLESVTSFLFMYADDSKLEDRYCVKLIVTFYCLIWIIFVFGLRTGNYDLIWINVRYFDWESVT